MQCICFRKTSGSNTVAPNLLLAPGAINAAQDLGPGVEQPFDCLIVQERQAMRSMGRSMDWSVKDNIVNGMFLYARGVKHTARCVVGSGPRDDFVKQKLLCLLEKSIHLYFNNW